jgi:hypothetical protein
MKLRAIFSFWRCSHLGLLNIQPLRTKNTQVVSVEGKVEDRRAERNRRLHKLEARKSKCLLVKRQRASTFCACSELCDQRVRE